MFDLGKHVVQETSQCLLDHAMLLYQESMNHHDHFQVPQISSKNSCGLADTSDNNKLHKRWALPKSRTRAQFSVSQRAFIERKYKEGERSGTKWDPQSVAEARSANFIGYSHHDVRFSF